MTNEQNEKVINYLSTVNIADYLYYPYLLRDVVEKCGLDKELEDPENEIWDLVVEYFSRTVGG